MRITPLWVCLIPIAIAQTGNSADDILKQLNRLEWRSIGPAAMGGRISGIEGVPGNPRLLYAATGSGGLFKTVNGGVTWQGIFERPETISIGDIAIDPKHPDTVWVGTGEANVRNSVSFGAPERRAHPQNRIAGDQFARDAFGAAFRTQANGLTVAAEYAAEDLVLVAQVRVHRAGKRIAPGVTP